MKSITQSHRNAGRVITLSLFLLVAEATNAQHGSTSPLVPSFHSIELPGNGGPFFVDIQDHKIKRADQVHQLNASFGLSDQYHFSVIRESEDQLGFIHTACQQYYSGLPVEEGMVLLHAKGDIMTSLNGRIVKLPADFSIRTELTPDRAVAIACEEMGIAQDSNHPEAILVISQGSRENEYVVAYKIYVEGIGKGGSYHRMNVFVDARTGQVINKINLIANIAVQGTAHTLYSGLQEITIDSFEGGYRLRDVSRNITTL
jgi:bacillolysin